MASNIPEQERVVDPYSSYNSNTVNQLTRSVSHGDNGLLTPNSLFGSLISSSQVEISTGYIIIQDMLIKITDSHIVDFNDSEHYYTPSLILPQVGGYHYIVLEYTYQKVKPAPTAMIKILKPAQRNLLTLQSNLFLLKVVELDPMSPHNIINLLDTDPDFPTNQREYLKYYAGTVSNLPLHVQSRDEGRVAFETNRQKYFFGYSDHWGELTAGGVSLDINTVDSTGVEIGMLCYIDENRNAVPAICENINKSADIVVTGIGTVESGQGNAVISGFVSNVPVESGIFIETGDVLYLSAIEPGHVTNVRPNNIYQVIGRSLLNGSPSNPLDIIFSPKIMIASSVSGQVNLWSYDIINLAYYSDIDVSLLDSTFAFDCHWWDAATNTEIQPALVEIRNDGHIIRVYMPVNTFTINYIIQSPSSFGSIGGGGGGWGNITDHALLSNLNYANSGHTGFAPGPHDNTFHSQTYITSSSVNFTNLNSNGGVGTGASQVAFGNHVHLQYVDIPSGTKMLFPSDIAVSGYTLDIVMDDMLVYITKGSAAGGEVGGTLKASGTWTQPVHNHSISASGTHTHTTGSVSLTVDNLPPHAHDYRDRYWAESFSNTYGEAMPLNYNNKRGGASYDSDNTYFWYYDTVTSSSGTGTTHNHGSTGSDGNHDHGGTTVSNSTPNTWRPRGLNFTLQTRI